MGSKVRGRVFLHSRGGAELRSRGKEGGAFGARLRGFLGGKERKRNYLAVRKKSCRVLPAKSHPGNGFDPKTGEESFSNQRTLPELAGVPSVSPGSGFRDRLKESKGPQTTESKLRGRKRGSGKKNSISTHAQKTARLFHRWGDHFPQKKKKKIRCISNHQKDRAEKDFSKVSQEALLSAGLREEMLTRRRPEKKCSAATKIQRIRWDK